jgi:starch synthase (maltosyl-transferring)
VFIRQKWRLESRHSSQAGKPALRQFWKRSSLYHHVQAQGPLTDVSPEYPLDYLPTPYEYNLRPGQGIVLVTRKGRK